MGIVESILAVLAAIPILGPILVKIIEVLLGTINLGIFLVKWLLSPITKLIINPLESLYVRLFRIMDIFIDLLERELIMIGDLLRKKVDDKIKTQEFSFNTDYKSFREVERKIKDARQASILVKILRIVDAMILGIKKLRISMKNKFEQIRAKNENK